VKNLRAILATLALTTTVLGLGFVGAAPAQAFTPSPESITYLADCPANSIGEPADWQRLTIVNNSQSPIHISVWEDYPANPSVYVGQTSTYPGSVTTVNSGFDSVQWDFTGQGNLNWTYRVDCFY
jgi:hypothetical protein